MKTIKSIIGLAIISLALVGCKTTPTGQTADIERIARVAKEATAAATHELLDRHPDWIAQFQIAHNQLVDLENSDTVSIEGLFKIIDMLPVKELKSNDARLAVIGARIVISAIDVPEVDTERLAQIRPIVKAIREGLEVAGVQ